MNYLSAMDELERIYDTPPVLASTVKETDRLTPHYRRLIEASPFLTLATVGPEGLDCSPRGDRPGFVRIVDERMLIIPDRRGNNRIDSLRNIVRDPRVALLFFIPGSGTTLRVNGRARIAAEANLLRGFAIDGKLPRSAMAVTIEKVYFQCARAILRAGLWDRERYASPSEVPSPGTILEALSDGQIEAKSYDGEWPSRAAKTMW